MKPNTTVYTGRFIPNPLSGEIDTACDDEVLVDGVELPLEPSLAVLNKSPTGFAWGYGGSGPSQLALAIILDFTGDAEVAKLTYQRFKAEHVAHWPVEGGWRITGDVIATWLEEEIARIEGKNLSS